jgi:Fe-S cluster biogenesis protein NfuA
MLARVVEMNVIPDKVEKLRTVINSEILPLLKKSPGFVDTIGLVNSKSPNTFLTILMFNTKTDLEKYERETVSVIMPKIRPFLLQDPKVEICNVETSTFHRISAGMAA